MADPTKDDDPPDFELRKYQLDRAHELELNKFAHALEVERLKILQLVNAGAFTVLIAFATDVVRSPGWPLSLALVAGLCWVAGLAAAALATHQQLKAQASFNQAYRHRRNAIECRRLSMIYGSQRAELMLAPLERKDARDTARRIAVEWAEVLQNETPTIGGPSAGHEYDQKADLAFYQGGDEGRHVTRLAAWSIALFATGAALLTIGMALAGPPQAAPTARVVVW